MYPAAQYQHYEEDEYERKRKRKLRESERKMFFYAGQSANGGGSGDKSKRKAASSVDKGSGGSGGASVSNKKRRRKERERERERVLDKDARRQLSGSAPMMMPMAGQRNQSSSFDSPPPMGGNISAERTGSMPNLPNMPHWAAAQNDRNASFYSASVPSGMPSHAQDMTGLHHQHQGLSSVQAASHLMRHRASMPQLPTQQHQYPQRPGGYLHLSAGHFSPSSSFDYMPQQSPLSSSLSSSASSSAYYTSPAPSPSPAAHIVPIRADDYAPSPPTYHHPQHRQVAMQQSSYASYYQPLRRYPHQQPLLATSLPAEVMLDAYGGHLTAEEQPNDATLDESWTSSSISASSSGELSSGSESFSCFGPFDPAALGGANAGDDGEDLACADMASAAAAAVENFMFANQHQHELHLKEESSPEGAQQHASGGVAVDEDWFNSFFSDPVGSPLLGGQTGDVGPDAAQCYPALDPSHIDALFSDVEAYYGRLVN
jgi:hypothetical protein